MKRETKHKCGNGPFCPWCRDEAKTTEQAKAAAKLARQAAELRRLREVLRVIATMPAQSDGGGSKWNHQKVAEAALKPARRKP